MTGRDGSHTNKIVITTFRGGTARVHRLPLPGTSRRAVMRRYTCFVVSTCLSVGALFTAGSLHVTTAGIVMTSIFAVMVLVSLLFDRRESMSRTVIGTLTLEDDEDRAWFDGDRIIRERDSGEMSEYTRRTLSYLDHVFDTGHRSVRIESSLATWRRVESSSQAQIQERLRLEDSQSSMRAFVLDADALDARKQGVRP